ncbi:hypothetical protein HPP92_020314 [Vanilla planifolia]|uniref:Uncharacterized protein n=1 Tax=Vanilla planifolia TaxID=51239 RepID=A0A835UKN7_VANPL|nr:hypothetical protein HPP92_020314 [Vanilla planifolia]
MAAPPSSASHPATDTVNSPQPSTSTGANSSKPFRPSAAGAPSLRSPMFSPQHLIGKPVNPSVPATPHAVLYPVGGAAHRGFPLRPAVGLRNSDQLVTVANHAGYLRSSSPMAVMNFAAAMAAASQSRPYVYSGSEHAMAAAVAASAHGMRPPAPQIQQQGHHFVAPRPAAQEGPLRANVAYAVGAVDLFLYGSREKHLNCSTNPSFSPSYSRLEFFLRLVASVPVMPISTEQNDAKEREKSVEDAFVMVRGRKVRLLDSGSDSLYALGRSWIRNGLTQETHSSIGDSIKLLPKPLPPSIVEEMLKRKENSKDEENGEDEHGDSVEHLSSQDLLAGHIKRAKRVRARLRRERLLRIERYKQRLSLLLPAPSDAGHAPPGS